MFPCVIWNENHVSLVLLKGGKLNATVSAVQFQDALIKVGKYSFKERNDNAIHLYHYKSRASRAAHGGSKKKGRGAIRAPKSKPSSATYETSLVNGRITVRSVIISRVANGRNMAIR
jgi:hypothetical protein